MPTPYLESAMVTLHSGAKLECRWYHADDGPRVFDVLINGTWTQVERDFQPATIEAWKAELREMLAEEADEAQFLFEHAGAI